MTAPPISWRSAPLRARLARAVSTLWTRAARAVTPRATAARRPLATFVQLACAAAFVKTGFEIVPAVGWAAVTLVLGLAGWMLQPKEKPTA